MPSSSIQAANDMVKPVLTPPNASTERSVVSTSITQQRRRLGLLEGYRIAKRSVQCGVTNTVRHFSREFADRPLSEVTVRTWVKRYKCELRLKKQNMNIDKLEAK